MKFKNLLKAATISFLTYASALSADTLLDSTNFNVTLNLAPTHYLTVSNLDFGTINPAHISEDDMAYQSTTGSLVAYSNGPSGHYVQIVPSEAKYLSSDGYAFLMLGQTNGNTDSVSFILNTSLNADGSNTTNGSRDILPGYIVASGDGSDASHKLVRDLWATLTDNAQLKIVSADAYLAVLTANHYSNQ